MGYGRALLMRDVREEEASLQKKAKKKSLWGSIGRTAGGLVAAAFTGGAVNPVTLGLLTGGASFLGGAIGGSTGGKLTGGRFFKSDREELQDELGAFGTENLMSSLKSGLTAGIGQKLKLMKGGKEGAKLSEGFGLDFEDSMVGKGWDKYVTQPKVIKAAGEESKLVEHLERMDEFTAEFGEGGGATRGLERMRVSRPDPYHIYQDYSGDQPTLQDIREFSITPTESISAFTPKTPSIPEEQIGGVDPLGLKRMRVSRPDTYYSGDQPIDRSFEFGEGGGRSLEFSDMLQESLGVRNRLNLKEGPWVRKFYDEKY